MKKIKFAISTIGMLILLFSVFLTCFQFVLYGDGEYKFYQKEYEKYNVTDSLNMEIEDVMEVTSYMMDYLVGKEEVLSIETKVDGKTQDFFNEQDRLHMEDVKNLFLGGLKIRNITLILGAMFLYVLYLLKKSKVELLSNMIKGYSLALLLFLVTGVALGGCFVVNFNAFFTTFHHVFFTNDLWLFDPATDYMIRMLPEGFFLDIASKILIVFLTVIVSIEIILVGMKKWIDK